MPFAYILFSSKTNKFYKGLSKIDNVIERLKEHNRGKVKSTKYGVPWTLIHKENYQNYTDARKREIFLKSGAGRKWLNEKFNNYKRRGG